MASLAGKVGVGGAVGGGVGLPRVGVTDGVGVIVFVGVAVGGSGVGVAVGGFGVEVAVGGVAGVVGVGVTFDEPGAGMARYEATVSPAPCTLPAAITSANKGWLEETRSEPTDEGLMKSSVAGAKRKI